MYTGSGEVSMLPAAVKRWLHTPKRSNPHPLAQFFYADKEVIRVMIELNNVNLHNDPQEYVVQLNNLRAKQDHMLQIINQIMDECIPNERPNREFQVKFPDEILQEHLGVQLWFAAECLVAGSVIEVQESEVYQLRPLAEDLLHSLEEVRTLLREQCFSDYSVYTDDIKASLVRFDRIFAEFEFNYVSAVIPIKSPAELFSQQQIIVLFCETIDRALKLGYLKQEMIDGLEPVLMFTIPRLAIICGLIIYPEGPLNLERQPEEMSRLFKPFYALLQKIRDLLYVLTEEEFSLLEKSLCAAESEDFFNPHTVFPSLPSLHNSTLHRDILDQPLHADDVSPICQDAVEHGHQPPNELYCYQSTSDASNSGKQTPNEIQHPLEGSNFILNRDNEMWGQNFEWTVNVGTQVDTQNQNRINFTDSPRSSLSTSNDSLTDSSNMQCCCVAVNNSHSDTEHPEFLDGLETMGASRMTTIQALNSPDELHVPTTSEQDYVSHFLNADCPGEHTEIHKPGAASFLGASPEQNTHNIISNILGTEDLHRNNSRSSLGENESRVTDLEMERRAIQIVQAFVREEIRSRYQNSNDMLHRLFVCISGVADQLQTNFAGDLRRILKTVFEIVTARPEINDDIVEKEEAEEHFNTEPSLEDCVLCQESHTPSRAPNLNNTKSEVPPEWVADSACNQCMSCKAPFTIIRRRHHCRNCGKIFCSRCSSQSAPLPWYGQMKPVRVCSHCYTFHLSSCYSSTSAS